ncbi:MAG: NAD(P)-dependent oxidoreductase [Micromonosporaceae bacterium]|nr:NAD(P)-dependent oxidoreductase [Micromonosporaceae bacterium]
MRVFVAGATGAIGQRLVPALVARGHTVAGTTRSAAKAGRLEGAGARAVGLDALDAAAVHAAVEEFKPDVIVHQLTAIAPDATLRRIDRDFAETNRLRTRGTDILLAAARAFGVPRFVAQSFAGWPFAATGGPVKTEADPLEPNPPASARETLSAIRHVEDAVAMAPMDGLVLRYGAFYGPGTSLGRGGAILELAQRRQMPVVGGGGGIWSFIHIDDAAALTVLAVEGGAPGLYQVVDDDPAPVREWVPYLAKAVGAPEPRHLPAWLVRPMLGEYLIRSMTRIRGASNAKAKAEWDWQLRYPSWREGFRHGLG